MEFSFVSTTDNGSIIRTPIIAPTLYDARQKFKAYHPKLRSSFVEFTLNSVFFRV